TCGSSRRTFWVALMPESWGRSTSMMRTSGSSSIVFATASSPSVTTARISMSGSFSRTWVMPSVVRRLASARTIRMAFSGLSAKRVPLLARWKQQCKGGPLSGRRLPLQSPADELRAFAHREQPDGPPPARHLHDVEADAVVGAVHEPLVLRPLPDDPDGRGLRVLVDVLQGLLHDAVDRELLRGLESGLAGVEVAVDAQAVAGLVLGGVVADRAGEPELGEDRWPGGGDPAAPRGARGAGIDPH